MSSNIALILIISALISGIVAPPVTKAPPKETDQDKDGLEDYMEYHRYLREVVNALESDSDFKKKLEQANEDDIRSGKIAHELQFVAHHVRTQLDEIKRRELERLKDLAQKQKELLDDNEIVEDPVHHHVDHDNPHTFEIDDLKKLIKKTTEDLAEADRKRRDEFKQYELQKEYERQQQLNHTAPDERKKLEKEFREMEDKHKKHEKLHEPGHKQQLEEVWEEQDHMQQDFNPKTFFMLHDLDGNGLWDETEVKALFIKELDKMYAAGAPEDDMRERAEEMERMRESVFNEVDTNKDGFIDFNEFLSQTKRNDFQQDHGWQGLDEERQFTDEEFEEYVRQHNAGYQQPPPPGYNQHIPPNQHPQAGYPPAGGYQPPPHPAQQQVPPGAYQVPPGGAQAPPGGYQVPPGGAQVPPGAYQVPPGAAGQIPQAPPQQYHQAQQQQYQQAQQQQYQQAQQQHQNPPQYQANQQYQPPQGTVQQQRNDQGSPQLNTNEVYPNQAQAGNIQHPQIHVQSDNAVHQQHYEPDQRQKETDSQGIKGHDEPVLKPKVHDSPQNKI